MARNWIVRGDPTSSGGTVISGSPFTDIDGIAVARITDQATCPAHKGVFPIVDGDATLVVDGQPVALHGSSLACGCKVLSAQQMHVFVDAGGSAGAGRGAALAETALRSVQAAAAEIPKQFQEQYRAVDTRGRPVAGQGYRIEMLDGTTHTGKTDGEGLTRRVSTDEPEQVTLVWTHDEDEAAPEIADAWEGC